MEGIPYRTAGEELAALIVERARIDRRIACLTSAITANAEREKSHAELQEES